MKTFVFMCCFIMAAAFIQAQIIHVPVDYDKIQDGINDANPGDTVLVSDGTYYEQINFLGKKPLMVASQFLMDGDSSHIATTIIDGSQISDDDTASVVLFISGEDTTSVLYGFTITGGRGTLDWYPTIAGGGIYARNSGLTLSHNIITANSLDDGNLPGNLGVNGGGIMIDNSTNSWSIIENNEISYNSITSTDIQCGGGGIAVLGNARIINNTIKSNSCTQNSADPAFYNYAGGLFYQSYMSPTTELVLQNNIIENNTLTGINGNGAGALLYESIISCTGNEFKGNKINGPMPQSLGGGGLALTSLKSGSTISGNTFINNESVGNGGGLYDSGTSNWHIIENNYFFNNSGRNGGALTSYYSKVKLHNNVFYNNHAEVSAGAVYLTGEDVGNYHTACLVNNSFSNNKASYSGALHVNLINILILNSIFWQDSAAVNNQEIGVNFPYIELAYCNIDTNMISHNFGPIILGGGMISEDPVFSDTLLNLALLSPCIETGTDKVACHGNTWITPLYDVDSLVRPWPEDGWFDMGAHEFGSIPVGVKNPPVVSRQLSVFSYPNPFADQTTIEYVLDKPGKATLTIYDQIGQQVAKLAVGRQDRGKHQVQWNAAGLPAGIYFYRLTAGNQTSTGKMVVQK